MTELDLQVADQIRALGVSRLVHFTPARNLPHILEDAELRSVASMRNDVRACYTPTDRARHDGHPDKLCCSVQYPNPFYFRDAKGRGSANYPDWVHLLLDPLLAATLGTVFTRRNAAAAAAAAAPGIDGLLACYARQVRGSGGHSRHRGPSHDPACPTDLQAEVLLPAPVALSAVHAIVFPTEAAALNEYGRLDRAGLLADAPPFVVCPGMSDAQAVTAAVTAGVELEESAWLPPSG